MAHKYRIYSTPVLSQGFWKYIIKVEKSLSVALKKKKKLMFLFSKDAIK